MKEQWNGFKKIEFDFEGFNATLVFPKTADNDKNWALKTLYRDAFPETEIELLKRGFHVAFLDAENVWGTKNDCDRKARFCKYLIKEYGLNEKLVPIGYSSGGAHAVNFAGYYPELIKCMYIDAPLLNYNACPGRIGSNTASYYDDFAKAYNGVTRFELFSLDVHPLCRIPTLIENKIPVFLTYGPQDTTLIAEEHAMLMVDAYNKNKDLLKVIVRECQGHHPHGLLENIYIVADFICENV